MSDGRGTETIVLVDDEDSLRRVLKRVLVAAGYQVIVAANGREALDLCAAHPGPIHLALSDVSMPRMSGPAFVRELAKLHPETRVLFMSGDAEASLDDGGGLGERHRLIAKPFNPEQLRQRVRDVLDAKA